MHVAAWSVRRGAVQISLVLVLVTPSGGACAQSPESTKVASVGHAPGYGGTGAAESMPCSEFVSDLQTYLAFRPEERRFAELRRVSEVLSGEQCCSAVPVLVAAIRQEQDDPVGDVVELLRLVSELDCPGTGDGLLPVLEDMESCRVGRSQTWVIASALGSTGSPVAHERLRSLWRSAAVVECDGEPALAAADIARGVTLTGDPSALPWLVRALDEEDGRVMTLSPIASTILAFKRLPRTTREDTLPALLAKMHDREYSARLAEEIRRSGVVLSGPPDRWLPDLPGASQHTEPRNQESAPVRHE